MHIDKPRYVLVAIAACASIGMFIATQLYRRQREIALKHDHASDLKSWENEGGNVAPEPARPTPS